MSSVLLSDEDDDFVEGDERRSTRDGENWDMISLTR